MILLQPFNLANVNIHFEWNNDADLNFYDSDLPHKNESFDSFVKRLKAVTNPANKSAEIFEIVDDVTGKVIGVIDISNIDPYNHKCEIECTIGNRAYRNKGYAKTALQEALRYCFEELDVTRVVTTGFDFNEQWLKLVEKLGFVREGELRNHALKRGKYCNKFVYGLLREEYKTSKSKWSSKKTARIAS